MLGLIDKFFSIRVFGIAEVCDGAHRRPSVNRDYFLLIIYTKGIKITQHIQVQL